MFPVQIRLFGTTLTSFFPLAVPYTKANLERIAEELLASFTMQGLAAEHIVLTKRNELFDYELSFQLFRGNAAFTINAERAKLAFSNASFSQDVTTITDVTVRVFRCLQLPEDTLYQVDANAHFTFASAEDFAAFFSTKGTKWQGEFAQMGITAYIADSDWPEQIRVNLDLSHSVEGGGFIMPSTFFRMPGITVDVLNKILGVFGRAAEQCQLLFKPLP